MKVSALGFSATDLLLVAAVMRAYVRWKEETQYCTEIRCDIGAATLQRLWGLGMDRSLLSLMHSDVFSRTV